MSNIGDVAIYSIASNNSSSDINSTYLQHNISNDFTNTVYDTNENNRNNIMNSINQPLYQSSTISNINNLSDLLSPPSQSLHTGKHTRQPTKMMYDMPDTDELNHNHNLTGILNQQQSDDYNNESYNDLINYTITPYYDNMVSPIEFNTSDTKYTKQSIQSCKRTKRNTKQPPVMHSDSRTSTTDSSSSDTYDIDDKDYEKKLKHQQTDRVRRARIKNHMDELKSLVVGDSTAKIDQATVVLASVNTIQGLKDHVHRLQQQVSTLQVSSSQLLSRNQIQLNQQNTIANPLSYITPVLNAAGVCMWRVSLDARILEVNAVFSAITGFNSDELVGRSPAEGICHTIYYYSYDNGLCTILTWLFVLHIIFTL